MTYTPSNTPSKPHGEKFTIIDFSALSPEGEPVWYFLAVPQSRREAFTTAMNQEGVNVDLTQFGKVLASGDGKQPPEKIRQEVMNKYAVQDN